MVDAGPEIEAHHHGHTGHRWLDIVLGVSAMVISVASLFLAIHHGQTMEKMVEASTWPYVETSFSNATVEGQPRAVLEVINSGVGPARIETAEMFFQGKAMPTRQALVKAMTGSEQMNVINSTVSDRVLRAGDKIPALLTQPDMAASPAFFQHFQENLSQVSSRLCYCSVLDQCWLRDSRQAKPEKVKACPKPAVPYDG
jgi:hypothetical protein